MDQLVLDTAASARIKITTIGGDLRLSGWDQNQISAEGDDESPVHLEKDGDEVALRADGNCSVRLPRGAAIQIQSVGGDARIKGLEAPLTIQSVGGDLILRQTAGVWVQSVAADLSAKRMAGALRAENVGGDLLARNVDGDFSAGNVAGDLYLRDVSGSIAGMAASDVTLSVDFEPGKTYRLEAAGDIACRLAADASGRFELAAAGEISVDVPGAQVEGNRGQRSVILGSGEPTVRLQSSGDIMLTGLAADPAAMGDFGERFGEEFGVMAEEIGAQVEAQMADLERQLSKQLSIDFGSRIKAEDIAAKARRAAERVQQSVQRRAERQAEAAARRVEAARRRAARETERARRLAEAAQRRAEAAQRRAAHKAAEHQSRHGGAWAFQFAGPRGPVPPVPPVPPVAPTPPPDPVSDEERLVILRMVEHGKISVADAEKLLGALEGK